MKNNSSSTLGGLGVAIIMLGIGLVFAFVLESCANLFTEAEWNDGICPKCEQRYELKAAGNYGLKYYVCPECHTEVERY